MNEMRWMTGSLIALALLTGGVASAQAFQPRNGAPQEQDDLSDEAQPPADDPGPPQADDDFSDVVAADQERGGAAAPSERSEEHTSDLQSLMSTSYADFCLKNIQHTHIASE